jgi:predicted NBD/HSP70 family sugar kinase
MKDEPTVVVVHGASQLPLVTVDAYNAELRSGESFIGDRASNRAFRAILDEWRERLRKVGDDPLGETPTAELSKKKLDKLLVEGDPEAAGVIQGAIEQFATELATVVERFLKLKAWRSTRRIVVGGGLRMSRTGELAIGRASVLLKASGHNIDLTAIRHHPDEAGLIGAVYLAPAWMFAGYDGVLAMDIGGSNIRAGIVELSPHKNSDFSKSTVREAELWRHADESPKPTREEAMQRIGGMLDKLARRAQKLECNLAPFIGVGCPGVIAADGQIERGGQNLPGNWESNRFNLPMRIRELVPKIGNHETTVVIHNDAVVQGLSELPSMQDVNQWGVLTVGTGLGNATFTNRQDAEKDE